MSKNLVIVESPAKAKTIEKFLGKDYHVLSSQGHVRDIEGIGRNSIGIDFEHQYRPNYVTDPKKAHLLDTLRTEARKADTVWLASDEDREGEAIAWHLKEVLHLQDANTRRIVFHEITETAIKDAILNPRDIDYNLVNAQQARRVLDRIVGFELSPVLWKKITTGLSAGRVQSVAVRLIVDREKEIESFQAESKYRIFADFIGTNPADASVLHMELNHSLQDKQEALAFLEHCRTASFRVESIEQSPLRRRPAAPFTTSSLQQEAARKLHFPVSKTMRLAQSLYEAGRITYMRTDSTNLSSLALATARTEILAQYGQQYYAGHQYQTHSKGAQEAHEAIRPTYMNVHAAGTTPDEKRLYELIWKRTIASQMADAELEATEVQVSISGSEYSFKTVGEIVTFDGFMRAYVQSSDDETEDTKALLPKMSVHESLRCRQMDAQQVYSKPQPRYNEASLVKKMEELGIGRPSTYASIIETIQSRHYVERGSVGGTRREYNILSLKGGKVVDKMKSEMAGSESQKLLPTDLGRMTTDFLVRYFRDIMDYEFTAREEETFDDIAAGTADWVETVDTFYRTFHPQLSGIVKEPKPLVELGVDPATGKMVTAKISKLGPYVQLGEPATKEEKPQIKSLPKDMSIYGLTLEQALELLSLPSLPRVVGVQDGEEVVVGEGKYGPYVRYEGRFISLGRDHDPYTISLDEAMEVIKQSDQRQQPLLEFGDIQVVNGRYGAYLKTSDGNYRLPREVVVAELTEERCREIIQAQESAEPKQKRTFRAKKS